MRHSTRRLLTGALLVLAAGTGVGVSPAAASAAGSAATIDVGNTLKVRSAPSLTAKVVGSLRDGQRITVVCAVAGQKVKGKVRTTTAWDRLSNGSYVSHSYVRTSARIPACKPPASSADPVRQKPATFVTGRVRSTDGGVNVRYGPSALTGAVRKVANGAALQLQCAVQGDTVSGTVRTTAQWDRLTDGRYISHAYVVSAALKACPAPATPAPTRPAPALTPAQFIAAAAPGAQQGWRQYGVPPSVTIAQAILESGWGRSGLSAVDRNYFGIKCQGTSYGPHATGCHVYRTNECTKAGRCFETADAFRTYATMAHSFRDHGHFLRANKRYAPAFGHTRDANKFIWTVWKAGYATDPKYYTKITGIMASYDLYRFDTWK